MIKLTDRQKKAIDVVQWICIIFLLIVCVLGTFLKPSNNDFVNDAEYKKEQAYVKIYESQSIEALKKENKELYDSIRRMQDVESAVQVKYVYKVKIDTIMVEKFTEGHDSIYHYSNTNDTLSCNLDIKAKELKWVKGDFTVNDNFMVINREKDGLNQTLVTHGPHVTINDVDAWHRVEDKEKWYKRFHFSVQAGAGYGIFSKNPDIYVGVGISYTIK